MSDLCIALISAFTGALSASVLALITEWISKHKKEKAALIEIKYWIGKYLKHIRDADSRYQTNRKNIDQVFEIHYGQIDYEREFSKELIDSLQYGKFNTDDLELIVGIKPNLSDLTFLTIKDDALLDSILLSRAQYTQFLILAKQRNEVLARIDVAVASAENTGQFLHVLHYFEDKIINVTKELMRVTKRSQEDLDAAYNKINKLYPSC